MTISDIKNTTDNSTQQGVVTPVVLTAAKPEMTTAVPATRSPAAKTQALIKPARKTPAKKMAAAPASAPAVKKTRGRMTPEPALNAAPKSLIKAPVKAKIAAPLLAQSSAKVTADKSSKQKKPKLVRDSFTIPKSEYSVLEDLKQRATNIATPAKKSELLRAGIKALASMTDAAFKSALAAVPTIKTGRPAKS